MERPNDWYVFFSVYGSHAVYNYAFRLDKKTGQALDFAPINEGTYFE